MRLIPISNVGVPPPPSDQRGDIPGTNLLDAYTDGGISSVAGIPSVQATVPPPVYHFDEYGNRVSDARMVVTEDSVEVSQDVIPPQISIPKPQPQAQVTVENRTAMMNNERDGEYYPSWRPTCRGYIDQVMMMSDGAHVVVVSDSGGSFAAFIPDCPIVEIRIRVELGLKYIMDDAGRRKSIADIILID